MKALSKYFLFFIISVILSILLLPKISCRETIDYSDALKEYPVGKFITIKGKKIHYIEKGSGKPVIMIHGFLYHTVMWKKNIDHLAKKFKVYAIDLWGWGYSERLENNQYSFELYGTQVAEFIKQLHIRNPVLIGQSMGGGISVYTAARYPELVSGLILIDPAVIPYRVTATGKIYQLPFIGEFLNSIPGDWLMKNNLKNIWFYDKSKVTDEYAREVLHPLKIKGTMEGAMFILRNVLLEPFVEKEAEMLADLNKPILIIHGREDRAVPLDRSEKLNRMWKGSRLVVFDRAGHTPHEEYPEKFNILAENFISRIR